MEGMGSLGLEAKLLLWDATSAPGATKKDGPRISDVCCLRGMDSGALWDKPRRFDLSWWGRGRRYWEDRKGLWMHQTESKKYK